jgi:hypothetical protein
VRIEAPRALDLTASERLTFIGCSAVGGLVAVAGLIAAPDRVWAGWLVASYYLLGLALAGLCFVAIHYTSGASWSVAVRRVPEAMAGTLPLAVALIAVALVVRPQLYGWTAGIGPGPALAFKRAWLSRPFFLARAAAYSAVWIAFELAIRRRSTEQDEDRDPRWTRANRRLSAAFLVVFGVTFTLASFDWIMSLEPTWYSTIFGIYNFSGLFAAGLAAVIVLALWLERRGPLRRLLNDEHLHDLGKLLFAFSTFWMYIWFSQYMLIWYTDMPAETSHFVLRTSGAWRPLFFANIALNWVVPFFLLLRRDAKRLRTMIGRVAAIVLIGHWLDVYLMIVPSVVGDRPPFSIWEIGLSVGAFGGFCLAFARVLGATSIIPRGDPQLVESLQYEH